MTRFELNIGLLASGRYLEDALELEFANTWTAISDRALDIEEALRTQRGVKLLNLCVQICKVRRDYEDEPTLVVRGLVEFTNPLEFHDWLYRLAWINKQDCIAVYYPQAFSADPWTGRGYLVGPHAADWGDFEYDKFKRY